MSEIAPPRSAAPPRGWMAVQVAVAVGDRFMHASDVHSASDASRRTWILNVVIEMVQPKVGALSLTEVRKPWASGPGQWGCTPSTPPSQHTPRQTRACAPCRARASRRGGPLWSATRAPGRTASREVYVQLWSVFGHPLTAALNACHAGPHSSSSCGSARRTTHWCPSPPTPRTRPTASTGRH